jgi:hypothetical protein
MRITPCDGESLPLGPGKSSAVSIDMDGYVMRMKSGKPLEDVLKILRVADTSTSEREVILESSPSRIIASAGMNGEQRITTVVDKLSVVLPGISGGKNRVNVKVFSHYRGKGAGCRPRHGC